ncbi:uncharacterized protein LODBEIA_P23920 [Lodderomyces beijingensis]|uniref:DUF3533 domain-containing protein n=1 Tax=Lodderomyces beijingensis TaxID=1775926 RepID=A0ABP0ZJ58_9ASCO
MTRKSSDSSGRSSSKQVASIVSGNEKVADDGQSPGAQLASNGLAEEEEQQEVNSGQRNYSFFSKEFSQHRKSIVKSFFIINGTLCVFVLAVFSIYWGSFYHRSSRYRNLKMLVVNEDDSVVDGIDPVFGDSFTAMLRTPIAIENGDWRIFNTAQFQQFAQQNNESVDESIWRLVEQQEYWASIHIRANASYNYVNALRNGDTSYNITANSIVVNYQAGRDFINMQQSIVPRILLIEKLWLQHQPQVVTQLAANVSMFNSTAQMAILTHPLTFTIVDSAPFTDTVLVAPGQVGFIYMIIITFFAFNFFGDVHQQIAKSGLNKFHFLIYRYLSSILTFAVLSLFFGLVSLAFQVDFTLNYGRAGFLVYWAIAFLTMCAVGLLNEIMAMLAISVYPPLLGFWLLSWVIINISPTFGSFALMNNFYKYGYAMPIYNSFSAAKTVFFKVSKNSLGRNFGILIAWWAVLTVVFPFMLKYFGETMARKAQLATQEAARAQAVANQEKQE